jgi:diamine N-acetyltransferase
MTDQPHLQIRRAISADITALAQLKRLTFRETFLEDFAIPYPAADLARFEAASYSEQKVATELADPRHASWVATDAEGALLAYAHCGPCKLPHPDATANCGELYQIYIRRSAQGLGLGKRLLATSCDWIEASFSSRVWLGVWSGNTRAQAFYAAAGFRKVGEYLFEVGDHRDEEFILRRE